MKWISVKDKMPKKNVVVFIKNKDGYRAARWIDADAGESCWENESDTCKCCNDFDGISVTHWMMPEQPKKRVKRGSKK